MQPRSTITFVMFASALCTLLQRRSLRYSLLQICQRLKALYQRLALRCFPQPRPLLLSASERLANVDNFDDVWNDWLEAVGVDIDCEIEENFERSQFMLDMDDGTHAQWRESQLGVLLILSREEVEELVLARALAKQGEIEGWITMTSWVMGFTTFLDQCLTYVEDRDDL